MNKYKVDDILFRIYNGNVIRMVEVKSIKKNKLGRYIYNVDDGQRSTLGYGFWPRLRNLSEHGFYKSLDEAIKELTILHKRRIKKIIKKHEEEFNCRINRYMVELNINTLCMQKKLAKIKKNRINIEVLS